jgi:hypothetical protein
MRRSAVPSIAWLGRRREPSDYALGTTSREIDNTGTQLGEVEEYAGVMAELVKALEKKGVRFNETCFKDGDIIHKNKHVVISRGEASEFINRALEGKPCALPGMESRRHFAADDIRSLFDAVNHVRIIAGKVQAGIVKLAQLILVARPVRAVADFSYRVVVGHGVRRSNENKMSDGGRGRASIGVNV